MSPLIAATSSLNKPGSLTFGSCRVLAPSVIVSMLFKYLIILNATLKPILQTKLDISIYQQSTGSFSNGFNYYVCVGITTGM